MAYGNAVREAAKGATVGAEGYFKLAQHRDAAEVVVNTDVGPWYREQSWPQGGERLVAPYGSGVYPTQVEVAMWVRTPQGWIPKVWDDTEKHVAPLLIVAEPGVVYRITREESKHPTRPGFRVANYRVEAIGRDDSVARTAPRGWATPKGRTLDAPPVQVTPGRTDDVPDF